MRWLHGKADRRLKSPRSDRDADDPLAACPNRLTASPDRSCLRRLEPDQRPDQLAVRFAPAAADKLRMKVSDRSAGEIGHPGPQEQRCARQAILRDELAIGAAKGLPGPRRQRL